MGQCLSAANAAVDVLVPQDGTQNVAATRNDYELVIRASKDLEYILEAYLGARGKGLHEKCTSVQHLVPKDLQKKIRYLATIRNKLVHERGFNHIPDRGRFIQSYLTAEQQLKDILRQHGRIKGGDENDICRMM